MSDVSDRSPASIDGVANVKRGFSIPPNGKLGGKTRTSYLSHKIVAIEILRSVDHFFKICKFPNCRIKNRWLSVYAGPVAHWLKFNIPYGITPANRTE